MTPLLPHINEFTEDCLSQDMELGDQKNGKHKTNGHAKPRKPQEPIACEEGPGIFAHFLTCISLLLVAASLPLSLFFVVKVVQEYERSVIFRLGRLLSGGARGPGVFFIIPCVDTYEKIDMRSQTYEIPPQEILTKDSVTVFVNAIMYYKVANAIHAVANVDDYSGSARLLAATTLRNVLGTMNLGEILSQRESIAKEMRETLDVATEPWGVKVERVEVKDVRVPAQLMRAMAAEAEAAREARAKVIAAEGEHKASRSLHQAAEVIMDSPAALQLRYLQTLNSISAENNSTVIFPVPIDCINSFMQNNNLKRNQVQFQLFQQSQQFQQFQLQKQPFQEDPATRRAKDSKLQNLIVEDINLHIPEEEILELDIPELDIPEIESPEVDFKIPDVGDPDLDLEVPEVDLSVQAGSLQP